ncbi:MAG: heparinase II/III family protein [Planctomycetota bacterium]|nr:heparinase II/III family protein [Planctomycetota bacterium]
MAPPKSTVPDRASNISDRAFWSALRLPPKGPRSELLLEAIALGKRGKRDDAYRLLAAHHRLALKTEWEHVRASAKKQPAPKAETLNDTLRHKFNAWHLQWVEFGPKIDWFPSSLTHDCRHGFHYMGWLRPAVTAFIQTGEQRYADFLVDLLTQYYDARDDARWRDDIRPLVFSGLGIAGRLPTFVAAYLALLDHGDLPAHTVEAFTKTFLGFGRYLDALLQTFVPANNGFCVATAALLHLARAFPEFDESPKWDAKAVKFIVQQAEEGFYEDGGNRERVWGYGLMHVHALTNAYDLASRYGGLGRHDAKILKAVRLACQWYAKSSGPGPRGMFPTYGDAGTDNRLSWVGDVQRFFPNDPPSETHLWGADRTKSYLLEPSGFAILRNGNQPDDTHINISTGEFAGWHSHWDLLSMNFWSKGVRLLEELCRFGPYANPLDTLLRAPESHNLCLIDGQVYDSRMVRGQDVFLHSDERIDYFSAYHRAYRYYVYGREGQNVSPNVEALVRRTVVLVKDAGYAVVLDSVTDINHPGFNRAITQHWHSPYPFQKLGRDRARTKGKSACLMVWAQPDSLHRIEPGVDFAGAEVAHLGTAEDRYSLRARRWMPVEYQGIVGFTTVIYPFVGATPKVDVRVLPTKGGSQWKTEAIEITSPAGVDRITLNPERLAGLSVEGKRFTARARVTLGGSRGETIVR